MSKKTKKFFFSFLGACLFFLSKISLALAQGYDLQIPLPGVSGSVSGPSQYIQTLFHFGLSLVGIAALLAIVIGGFMYLSSGGNETRKTSGKEWIWGAVIGLVLMLCSWLILNTINPKLTSLSEPGLQRVTITGTVDNYDPVGAGQYAVPPVGNTSSSMGALSQYNGQTNGTAIIIDKSDKTLYVYENGQLVSQAPVGIGAGDPTGAQTGGTSGDKITPTGDFTITNDIRSNPNGVFSGQYGSNMGPAFLGLSATDQSGNYRGIGIHGSGDDSLRATAGCIRLQNADVIALSKVIQPGTPVKIRN